MNFIMRQLKRVLNLILLRPGTIAAFGFVVLGVLTAWFPKGIPFHFLIIGLALIASVMIHEKPFRPSRLADYWPVLVFLTWLGVACFYTVDKVAVLGWATFLEIILALCVTIVLMQALQHLNDQDRNRAQLGFLWGVFIALSLFAIEVFFHNPFYHRWHNIPPFWDAPPHVLNRSATVLFIMVWPAALILWQRRWQGSAVLFIAACCAFAFFIDSMAAQAGLAVGVGVWLVSFFSRGVARALCIAGLLIGFAGAVPIASQLYKDGLRDAAWLPGSARHRIEIWHFASERILEKPVFGWGLESSREIPNEGEHSIFLDKDRNIIPLHPHNVFLQIWLELGAIGACISLLTGLWILYMIYQQSALMQVYMLPAFAAAMTMASFAYGIWQMWWFCTLLMGAVWFHLANRNSPSS